MKYLIFPDLTAADARNAQEAQARGCNMQSTSAWWNAVNHPTQAFVALAVVEGDEGTLSEAEIAARGGFVDPLPWDWQAVPASITPLQARRALRAVGLLDTVQAAVDAAGGDLKDAWEYATRIDRSDPYIAALAAQLGLTVVQVDDLFRRGNTL